MSPFLSKSDFKIAQSCAAKLYFKKNGFPTSKEDNEYLLMLADGGYMIGTMAQLLFEGGFEIKTDNGTEFAIKETEQYLEQETVTLFEPAIEIDHMLVRVDILQKEKNVIRLIEVKSKSFDSIEFLAASQNNKKYFELAEWKEYIEDIAFQKHVLQKKFPGAKIEAYLMMPDKAKTTPIEGLIDWFQLQSTETVGKTKFRKTEVVFSGNVDELRKGHILEMVNVDVYVDKIMTMIAGNAQIYLKALQTNTKIDVPIETSCSKCEFTETNTDFATSGFQQCWGRLADVKPHLFELAQLGNFNRSKEKYIDTLIKQGKVNLNDMPLEAIENKYSNRPYYQITKKHEFLLNEITEEIKSIRYPLFFIDFETSQMAIPYHAGMRPYGKVVFQWSCHVIEREGQEPKHHEWLNTVDKYPNFEFAKALRNLLGERGTIMIWSPYENTILKDISSSFETMDFSDVELKAWLQRTIRYSKEEDSRIIDLHELAKRYYFHPKMGGRTSIKVTLPAVLAASKSEKIKKYLVEMGLYRVTENNEIIDPYKQLPKLELDGEVLDVSNGTDAMMAYQEMLYGKSKANTSIKSVYENMLLQYCKLDTLAMVIVWEHWISFLKQRAA
ncbi:uncharacterized protein DUF2779 [Lacibacter cauensis]|uniref:Uncharacterized protein DUF2779 n=1 Tax=Lacibacter cauensis TaxID=510947 RepID=A0A562S970_9BACT|nr:DUF2779 domain-containing protein [Lacibacter cauensis]TWI77947.1 uncharacterized protein DUF2779 [Lacibacter cauensis]